MRSLGPWGPAGIVLLHVAQIVLAPVPGYAIPFLAGALYGPLWGFLWDAAGMILGSWLAYGIGRWLGRPAVVKLFGEEALRRAEGYISGKRLGLVFLAFALPGLPKDLMCYAAGTLGVPAWAFWVVVLFERLPADAFVVLWGKGAISLPLEKILLLAAATAVGLGLLWWVGLKLKKRFFP